MEKKNKFKFVKRIFGFKECSCSGMEIRSKKIDKKEEKQSCCNRK